VGIFDAKMIVALQVASAGDFLGRADQVTGKNWEAISISISGLFFLALFGHFLTRSGSKKLKSHERTSGTNFSTS